MSLLFYLTVIYQDVCKNKPKNGHSRDTGNIGHTRHRTKKKIEHKTKQTKKHTQKT
jgi:hypothetical protein